MLFGDDGDLGLNGEFGEPGLKIEYEPSGLLGDNILLVEPTDFVLFAELGLLGDFEDKRLFTLFVDRIEPLDLVDLELFADLGLVLELSDSKELLEDTTDLELSNLDFADPNW